MVQKTLYLFQGLDVLVFVLENQGENEPGLEIVLVSGLSREVVLIQNSVKEELGVVDELQLLFNFSKREIKMLESVLIVLLKKLEESNS